MKREAEKLDEEVNELKLERMDIINHIKMSQQVKKSKNSAEIA